MVQLLERGTRVRGHGYHPGFNQNLIQRADVCQIAIELSAALVNQEQTINQVLGRIDSAEDVVAVRKVVLAFHDQKARKRPVGHVGCLQRLPEMQRCGRAVDAGTGLVDGAVRVVVLRAGVLHAKVGGSSGGVQLGHQIQDLAHIPG